MAGQTSLEIAPVRRGAIFLWVADQNFLLNHKDRAVPEVHQIAGRSRSSITGNSTRTTHAHRRNRGRTGKAERRAAIPAATNQLNLNAISVVACRRYKSNRNNAAGAVGNAAPAPNGLRLEQLIQLRRIKDSHSGNPEKAVLKQEEMCDRRTVNLVECAL